MRSVTIATLICIASLSLHIQVNGQSRKGKANSPTSSPARRPSLDEEAQREVRSYWAKKFKACGESSYGLWFSPYNPNISNGQASIELIEGRGMRWTVEGREIIPRTEAERLNQRDNPNSVQWQGGTRVYFTAWRAYKSQSSVSYNKGWNRWQEGRREYQYRKMVKQNGRWIVYADDYGTDRSMRPVDCSKIPEITSTEQEALVYAAEYGNTTRKPIDPASNKPTNYISTLGARVEAVNFFENDGGRGSRTYGRRFPSSSSRYLNWEVVIKNRGFGREITNPFLAIWHKGEQRPDWSEQKGGGVEISGDNLKFISGFRMDKWEAGLWRIKLYENGILVAVGEFELYDDF